MAKKIVVTSTKNSITLVLSTVFTAAGKLFTTTDDFTTADDFYSFEKHFRIMKILEIRNGHFSSNLHS